MMFSLEINNILQSYIISRAQASSQPYNIQKYIS